MKFKKNCITWFTIVTIILLSFQTLTAESLEVVSPNGINKVTLAIENGVVSYSVSHFNRDLLKPSKLGMVTSVGALNSGFTVESTHTSTFDETWTQPWGEVKDIRNHYNELKAELVQAETRFKMNIIFRVFDDGFGFRYEIPEQSGFTKFDILDEETGFNLAGDYDSWWIKAYMWNRYEYLYQNTAVSKIDTVHTPFTMQTRNGIFLSIHEAALTDYASMTLARIDGCNLKADLTPWSDGIKVKTQTPLKTPWRTIQIAEDPGGLITSYLILNLNEPCKLADVSWIKPAKYNGIWWEMHLEKATWGSGPKHGATTENTKKYIDFAAKNGLSGVLVEGWNLGWDGDWINNGDKFKFTTPAPDYDIKQLVKYAALKNVEIIGHNETGGAVMNYEAQLTDAFKYYEKLGIRCVKTGYVNYSRGIKRLDENGKIQGEWHHGQYMVRHYRHVVEEAAKHHIMIDAHEPIKDTGERRTYPNFMTREGARGQEFNAWSDDGGNPPEHTTILPFTRLLAGPMDFTPGIFDLLFEKEKPNNRVNTTLAKQLALYIVIYSPLHMAADLPENYEANPAPFQFIKDVPTDWQDTQVLNASIGNYVTIVRQDRSSRDWYLGSVTDDEGRLLHAPLTFLEAGVNYTAEIYRDGNNADWKTAPFAILIEKKIVNCNTILDLRLAPGGGQAIRFSPAAE